MTLWSVVNIFVSSKPKMPSSAASPYRPNPCTCILSHDISHLFTDLVLQTYVQQVMDGRAAVRQAVSVITFALCLASAVLLLVALGIFTFFKWVLYIFSHFPGIEHRTQNQLALAPPNSRTETELLKQHFFVAKKDLFPFWVSRVAANSGGTKQKVGKSFTKIKSNLN